MYSWKYMELKKKNCNFAYCAVIAPERRYVNINTYTYKVLKQHVGPILEYYKKMICKNVNWSLFFRVITNSIYALYYIYFMYM